MITNLILIALILAIITFAVIDRKFGYTRESLKALLIQAPDDHIPDSIKFTIKEWNNDFPTALQVLKTLDYATLNSNTSTLGISILDNLFDKAIKREKTTSTEVFKKAALLWRANDIK